MTSTPKIMRAPPCVFFDRDGIANVYPGPGRYVERVADFHIQPEFLEAVALAAQRGYACVVVTNQRGVTRGITPADELSAMHARLLAAVAERGLRLLDIKVCTAGEQDDPRRKPNPGMLLEAAREHGIDLTRSWMIGDAETDIEAGRRAGVAVTVLVKTNAEPATAATWRVPDMRALVTLLHEKLPPM